MGGGKNSVTSGAAVPATCRPAPVTREPWMSRSPHALPPPEYRLAPRVGSIPTPRVVMPAGFPWCQGMLCGDGIASVKFSLPVRLHAYLLLSGYHKHHRGEWRKRRQQMITQEGDTIMVPQLQGQEKPSIEDIDSFVQQAMTGDESTLPTIRALLAKDPAIWQTALGLVKRVENEWIRTIAGQDLFTRET